MGGGDIDGTENNGVSPDIDSTEINDGDVSLNVIFIKNFVMFHFIRPKWSKKQAWTPQINTQSLDSDNSKCLMSLALT